MISSNSSAAEAYKVTKLKLYCMFKIVVEHVHVGGDTHKRVWSEGEVACGYHPAYTVPYNMFKMSDISR